VAYLSAEFLLGPHFANNMLNLKLTDNVREAKSMRMFGSGLQLVGITEDKEQPHT
jgi:starch phosphorylase